MLMIKNDNVMGKSNIILLNEDLNESIENNKIEKDIEKAKKLYLEAVQNKQKEIEELLPTLEIMPLANKLIVSLYVDNPYAKKIQNGIILDSAGLFKNPDTGEIAIKEVGIPCAKVIEVGPDVKYVKVGDDIYFQKHTEIPIPFFNMGYHVVPETAVTAVIASGLSKRLRGE